MATHEHDLAEDAQLGRHACISFTDEHRLRNGMPSIHFHMLVSPQQVM